MLYICPGDFPGGSDGKESACNVGDLGSIPESGRSLEKGMATHSSILAWWAPLSMGSEESDTSEQLTIVFVTYLFYLAGKRGVFFCIQLTYFVQSTAKCCESVSLSVVSDSLRSMDCCLPGSSVHEILQEYWQEY